MYLDSSADRLLTNLPSKLSNTAHRSVVSYYEASRERGEGWSVQPDVIHLAIIVRGGKCSTAINHLGGRSLGLSKIPGFNELNSGHAEIAVISSLENRCDPKKLKRKRSKCRLYSLAFHCCNKTGCVSAYMAQPCRMCSRVIQEKGFTEVWYSSRDGQVISRAVVDLVGISTRSFGERRLEWIQHSANLAAAKSLAPLLELHLRDHSSLEHIRYGRKSIEGRLWRGLIRGLARGQYIYLCSSGQGVPVQITFIRRYRSFAEMLNHGESLTQTLPDLNTVTDGIMQYNTLYRERDQTMYDAVAIGFRRVNIDLGMKY